MSTNSGDGFGAALFCVLILVVVFLLGFLASEGVTRSACTDYGKMRLFSVLYECKALPKKD